MRKTAAAVITAWVLGAGPIDAQGTDRAIVPDTARAALGVLDTAVARLGGRARVELATSYEAYYVGFGVTASSGQAWSPVAPVSTTEITRRLLVDELSSRARREGTTTYPGPIRFHTLLLSSGAVLQRADLGLWRTGTDLQTDAAAGPRARATWARTLAQSAVRQALAATPSLGYGGETTANGRRVHVVRYTDESGQRVTLHVDAVTGVPASSSPGEIPGSVVAYDDYRAVDGLAVPHHVIVTHPAVVEDLRLVGVNLSPDVAAGRFTVPDPYVAPPQAGPPQLTRLAEGVYRFDNMPGDYHSAVVDLGDGLAVFDAPQSTQWSERALQLIRAEFGSRPVRYVLVSHHHSDHQGGLATYAAAGATIVTGSGVDVRLREMLPDTVRARTPFQVVADTATLGGSNRSVRAYAAPNDHADGSLIFHVADAGVLLQGDLFYIPERGPVPPAFAVSADLKRVIDAHRLSVRHIVGVHGRTGTLEELELSLARRSRLP